MNCKQIIVTWLKQNGADGLCEPETECGCGLDDLAPCGDGPHPKCKAALKRRLMDGEYIGDGGPGDMAYFVMPNSKASEGLGLPVAAYDAGGEVRIEAAKQMDGRVLWKVREHGNVLAKTGEWEWEPMPSGRDDEFLDRCRFDTPQEALACLRGAKW